MTQKLLCYIVLAFMLCSPLSSPPCLAGLHDTTYDHLFKRYAEIHMPEYDWRWVKVQAYQESRYNPAAVSPVGATGLMQIMPGTGRDLARRTGISGPLVSPAINVLYGTTYMRQMLVIWSAPRPLERRLELAQASYNAGAGHVIKAQKKAQGARDWSVISTFMHLVTGRYSKETIDYVAFINRWYILLLRQENANA